MATNIITIDFETYYDKQYSLKKMTTEEFVRDPRFEVMCVAVKIDDQKTKVVSHEVFKQIVVPRLHKHPVLCHHAHFDGLILSHHYGAKPALWLDTVSMANALVLPFFGEHQNMSLDSAVEFLRLDTDKRWDQDAIAALRAMPPKGDFTKDMMGLHWADLTEETKRGYMDYAGHDADLTWQIFKAMAPRFPAPELMLVDMTIRMMTEPELILDRRMLEDYMERDQARQAEMFKQHDISLFRSGPKFAKLLQDHGIQPEMKRSPTTGKETYAFAKDDVFMMKLLDHEDETIRRLAEGRVYSKSTIKQARSRRLADMATRGPACIYLSYGKAKTLRWAGGDKTNWQNNPRVAGGDADAAVLRNAVMAPEGKSIIVADSSQIEARGVAWFSEHQELVDAFAGGRDVYSEQATLIYGRPVDRMAVKEDFIPGFVGKTCVLGMGYGMGTMKAAVEFMKGPFGGPPIVFTKPIDGDIAGCLNRLLSRGEEQVMKELRAIPTRLSESEMLMHVAVTHDIVRTWRRVNDPIVQTWRSLNNLVLPVLAGDGDPIEWGPVVFKKGEVMMPNGIPMPVPCLEHFGGEWRYGPDCTKIYGAKLLENVIQALSRHVVAYQALRIRQELGIPIKLMAHDEIVGLQYEDKAGQSLNEVLDLMKEGPAWAKGWPLAGEGGVATRYGEAK